MKLIIASFCFLFFCGSCIAQDKSLPFDERGKLIYYEVVDAKGISKDSLTSRANWFLKKLPKSILVKKANDDTGIVAAGKLLINKSALGMARPMGAVNYNFYAEMKEGKYRFWLTDFEFVPYNRDRYGNFVPTTPIGVPLEREPGKLAASEWASYLKITAKESKIFADRFKLALSETRVSLKVEKAKNTISTKQW